MPTKRSKESRKDFVSRCMSDEKMKSEFPDNEQRLAVCYSKFTANQETEDFTIYRAEVDSGYEIKEVDFQGKSHWIVPVVMMVEGVHTGSNGPLLHSAEDLGYCVDSWNDIPITIAHPKIEGKYVSAASPNVLASVMVGRVYNSKMDGNKLKGEAWLDKDRLKQVSPLAYEYISKKQPLDVSLGMFNDVDLESGQWSNEQYVGIARNHRPNHLALLPNERGACSWEDGCGIRVNSEKISYLVQMKKVEKGYQEKYDVIRRYLDSKEVRENGVSGISVWYSLEDFFDAYFIYRIQGTENAGIYQQEYSIVDGKLEIIGAPIPVQRETKYVQVNVIKDGKTPCCSEKVVSVLLNPKISTNNNSGKDKDMHDAKPCCPEKVELLIQDNNSKFTEADREWLLTLNAETIEKLQPVVVEKVTQKEVKVNTAPTKEQALEVLKETLKDKDQFLSLMPAEMKRQFEFGLQAYHEHRTDVINMIKINAKEVWTDDELNGMELPALQKIQKALKPTTVYVGTGKNPATYTDNSDEMLLPAGFEVKK